MNPVLWLGLLIVGVLLTWDWLIKRRRVSSRPEVGDREFLSAYRGPQESPNDPQILEARRRIAKELSLPTGKIRPEDQLTTLRDRYCLVVSGHLALGDLLDDLEKVGKGTDSRPASSPETVGEYISAFLVRLSQSGRADEQ